MRKLDSHAESVIKKHGWMAQYVFPTAEAPGVSFTYSVGLHELGFPELIVLGLPPEIANLTLHAVLSLMKEAKRDSKSVLGQQDIDLTVPIVIREVEQQYVEDYAVRAIHRSEGQAKFLQICFPDSTGKFAWESGFTQKGSDAYKVLGPILH